MRKFPKQIVSLTLGLILLGSLASRASAGSRHPAKNVASANCSPSANGPLEPSSSYAFQALGADLTATVPKNVATSTLVGSFVTDANGCPTGGWITLNDNGFVCTSTFTSFIVEGSPNNTGTMVWTSPACLVLPAQFVYASASSFSDVLYFSSNGLDFFTFAGKAQENLPIASSGSGDGNGSRD
jgi:hypothetical protein